MRSLEKEKAQVHKNQILNGEEFIEEKKTRRNKHKKRVVSHRPKLLTTNT